MLESTPPSSMLTEQPILVFDGCCVLCDRSVQFVLRHDLAQRYRFATTQSETGRELLRTHGFDPEAPASVLLIDETGLSVESNAIVRVLTSFGGGWRLLAVALKLVPRCLRDRAYRFIARRRYRWFGRRDICRLPIESERRRFLS